jgi:hypothetical protein
MLESEECVDLLVLGAGSARRAAGSLVGARVAIVRRVELQGHGRHLWLAPLLPGLGFQLLHELAYAHCPCPSGRLLGLRLGFQFLCELAYCPCRPSGHRLGLGLGRGPGWGPGIVGEEGVTTLTLP